MFTLCASTRILPSRARKKGQTVKDAKILRRSKLDSEWDKGSAKEYVHTTWQITRMNGRKFRLSSKKKCPWTKYTAETEMYRLFKCRINLWTTCWAPDLEIYHCARLCVWRCIASHRAKTLGNMTCGAATPLRGEKMSQRNRFGSATKEDNFD